MKLSRGARLCLKTLKDKFFRGKQTCWPKRETIAREMDVTVRQVCRYLAELRAENVLSVIRRPNTSCLFTLQAEMSSPMSSPNVLSILKGKDIEVKKLAEPSAKLAAIWAGPEPTIMNEYGRTDRNPEHQRLMDVLRAAWPRIEAARNPLAYRRAIIADEYRRQPWKLHETPRKSVQSEGQTENRERATR